MISNLQILALVVASTAASAYLVDQRNEQKLAFNLQQSQDKIKLLQADIAQLKETNAQLNSLIKNKEAIPDINSLSLAKTLPPKPTPIKETPATSTKKLTESIAVPQPLDDQLLRKSENFSKWLSNTSKEKGSLNLQEEMQHLFDTEAVDPGWAEMQEQEYLALFDSNPELAGLALRETHCRSQQCALTISISDINQANTLLEKMTATLKQQNKYPMIIATPDERRGITTLYIGKDANSFEFN